MVGKRETPEDTGAVALLSRLPSAQRLLAPFHSLKTNRCPLPGRALKMPEKGAAGRLEAGGLSPLGGKLMPNTTK